jgi:glutathione peroxidase
MSDAIYNIPVMSIAGSATSLAQYRGKVLLIVNVASKCGLTPQYTGLEQLYRDKQPAGLEILGFPANDFAAQEPGTNEEIASFCSTEYDVTFPLFARISVKGSAVHPLYRELIREQPEAAGTDAMRQKLLAHGMKLGDPTEVLWNFEKFLVDRKGNVVERFSPDTTAADARLTSAIDRELGA